MQYVMRVFLEYSTTVLRCSTANSSLTIEVKKKENMNIQIVSVVN
jgi:hypothetical protein